MNSRPQFIFFPSEPESGTNRRIHTTKRQGKGLETVTVHHIYAINIAIKFMYEHTKIAPVPRRMPDKNSEMQPWPELRILQKDGLNSVPL